ncbi:MAG: hypothetical protein ACYS0G_04110 [Planctomycetota bacterium]
MSRARRPQLRLDPGWLFVVAGLAVCAAWLLVPAQQDLNALRRQVARLSEQEAASWARLNAQAEFLRQLDQDDPALVRRLAAAQLNLMPAGETPVLLASSRTAQVTDWIDATVEAPSPAPDRETETLLCRLTSGPYSLWVLAAGVLGVLMGLVLKADPASARRPGTGVSRRPHKPETSGRRTVLKLVP